jgi:hypothetical protein
MATSSLKMKIIGMGVAITLIPSNTLAAIITCSDVAEEVGRSMHLLDLSRPTEFDVLAAPVVMTGDQKSDLIAELSVQHRSATSSHLDLQSLSASEQWLAAGWQYRTRETLYSENITETNSAWRVMDRSGGVEKVRTEVRVGPKCALSLDYSSSIPGEGLELEAQFAQLSQMIFMKFPMAPTMSSERIPFGLAHFMKFAAAILVIVGVLIASLPHLLKDAYVVGLGPYRKVAVALPCVLGSLYSIASVVPYVFQRTGFQNGELAGLGALTLLLTISWFLTAEMQRKSIVVMYAPSLACGIIYTVLGWSWFTSTAIVMAIGAGASIGLALSQYGRSQRRLRETSGFHDRTYDDLLSKI